MAFRPGVFDERGRANQRYGPQLPANCVLYGSGRAAEQIIELRIAAILGIWRNSEQDGALEVFRLPDIYGVGLTAGTTCWLMTGEANADGDVWVSNQGTSLAWDRIHNDCDFTAAILQYCRACAHHGH